MCTYVFTRCTYVPVFISYVPICTYSNTHPDPRSPQLVLGSPMSSCNCELASRFTEFLLLALGCAIPSFLGVLIDQPNYIEQDPVPEIVFQGLCPSGCLGHTAKRRGETACCTHPTAFLGQKLNFKLRIQFIRNVLEATLPSM